MGQSGTSRSTPVRPLLAGDEAGRDGSSCSAVSRDSSVRPNRRSGRAFTGGAAALMITALAACGTGDIEPVSQYVGAIVADEPLAVNVARDILLQGGTAADAAAALYFALSVTFPAHASLGAGGACLVFTPATGKAETLTFYGGPGSGVSGQGGRPTAVPTAVRGFSALQARFGRMRWAQVVAPAEALARFETKLPRALAREFDINGPFVYGDEQTRRVFGAQGRPAVEGDAIVQRDLAQTLTEIRTKGASELYTGALAARLVAASRAAGGTLTAEDLADVRPQWRDAPSIPLARRDLFIAPDPAIGSVVAAVMANILIEADGYDDQDDPVKLHALAEASMIAFADRATWFSQTDGEAGGRLTVPIAEILDPERAETLWKFFNPDRHLSRADFPTALPEVLENQAGTGFTVVDPTGLAVSCMITMNNPFGVGRIAPGTGIMLAADPNLTRGGATPLTFAMIADADTRKFYGGLTASGGVLASTAMIRALVAMMVEEQSVAQALEAPRLHNSGNPDITFYERTLPAEDIDRLKALGHRAEPFPGEVSSSPPKVNIIFCDKGFPGQGARCEAVPDPRGAGLSFGHTVR